MPPRRTVEFLIVVALDAELGAAMKHFGPLETVDGAYFGEVPRSSGRPYTVAIISIGDMGPEAAQRETTAALSRIRAHRVILIGIAAGFPESSVEYGDLMIPQWISDYEKVKIKEVSTGKLWWKKSKEVLEDRGRDYRVNQSLLQAAQGVAKTPGAPWAGRISIKRPKNSTQKPTVFVGSDFALGSGSKLVASSLFSGRIALVAKGTLGLEMESIGVVHACITRDIPFLVIKASQDPATALKDRVDEKDAWREYACDAAAAFARELIGVFVVSHDSLISEHLNKLDTAVRADLARELPEFPYRVSQAPSLEDLTLGQFQAPGQPLSVLFPNDSSPRFALIGGGGTGKSNAARRLIQGMSANGMCPALFDLSNYRSEERRELASREWSELSAGDKARVEKEVLEELIKQTTVPRRSDGELRILASETEFVSVVDGLNEVGPVEQRLLLDYLRDLTGTSRSYLVVAARVGVRENLGDFRFAALERMTEADVRENYDRAFRSGAYDELEASVQLILRRPFFLALAMRGPELKGLQSWSGIFVRFFFERLHLNRERLSAIAQAAFNCLNDVGGFNRRQFEELIGAAEYQNLVAADVLSRGDRAFEHELWKDYFASSHLALHRELWTQEHFDRVTGKASSFECFPLTIEQIDDAGDRDRFIKTVYDWSVEGAVECLYYAEGDDRGDISSGLRVAMLAVIAEKQFDRIENTRKKSLTQLRAQRSGIARRFVGLPNRERLVEAVLAERVEDAWFSQWSACFALADGAGASDQLVEQVADLDSVLGWTASNVLKRLVLSAAQRVRLRALYAVEDASVNAKVIRWRVVHSLGAFGDADSIVLLGTAAANDPSMWVRYGAVRSLVEIAATSATSVRTAALSALDSALSVVNRATKIDRRRLLSETLDAAFVRGALPAWEDDANPHLVRVLSLADTVDLADFQMRIDRFVSKAWPW